MSLQGVDTILSNLTKYESDMMDKMTDRMDVAMIQTENQSKRGAPWKDRTGNARNSIFGRATKESTRIIGYHGIGMPYGVFLELSNQGKYRIIWPTMDWLRGKLLNIITNG